MLYPFSREFHKYTRFEDGLEIVQKTIKRSMDYGTETKADGNEVLLRELKLRVN